MVADVTKATGVSEKSAREWRTSSIGYLIKHDLGLAVHVMTPWQRVHRRFHHRAHTYSQTLGGKYTLCAGRLAQFAVYLWRHHSSLCVAFEKTKETKGSASTETQIERALKTTS